MLKMDRAKNFTIWLDGFLEGRVTLNEDQTLIIKNKLNGIFDHEAMDSVVLSEKPSPPIKPPYRPCNGWDEDGAVLKC